jgi:crotonobetainyl-CoA:carnitine CoA-transferase CaiB-like acyl-CoA transferase
MTDMSDIPAAARTGQAGPATGDAPLPLAGLKVIDLTHARAGPTAVRHLADWGAEVIRIDPPAAEEGSPAYEDVVGKERGSDWQNLHRNKRSIRLNLKSPDGLAVFKELVKGADVLIENMRPAVKHRLGVAYDDLSGINPRLVYGSISGFGQVGPYRDRPGFDQIAQALNVMMALYQRQRTGRGCWVHTSLVEGLLFMMDFQATRWLVDKEVPHRVGNEHPTAVPTDVFATQDGHITLSAPSSRMWPKLCAVLDRPEWAQKPEWLTRDGRRACRVDLLACIAELIRVKPTEHWIELFNAAGVTCGPIYTVDQAFADEQIATLNMALPVEHPQLGQLHLVASPMNFEGMPQTIRRPTPTAGADSERILRELGYSAQQIDEMRAAKVF